MRIKNNEEILGVQVVSTVMEDTKHNSALIRLTESEFEKAGFQFGDSCDVIFENGYKLYDVPYYDGFYTEEGTPVIVANQGTPTILITLDNIGIWNVASLVEDEKITIRLNTKGKYNMVQDIFSLRYSNNRDDYDSDEKFCNFRVMTGRNLKDNFFFRGASPINDIYGRELLTNKLIEEKGIKFEVNFADSLIEVEALLQNGSNATSYVTSLYENHKVVMLGLGSNYRSDIYRKKVANGMIQMMNAEGPIYIHCIEGKDRTGFICILLEALAGATYDEMLEDFIISYRNYYSVDENTTSERYKAIVELYFNDYICCLCQENEISKIKNVNYSDGVVHYLLTGGMIEEEIKKLKNFVTK